MQDVRELADGRVSAAVCYVGVGSREQALAIARVVVEERLAAAANVIDGMSSIYWWRGALEQATETLVVLKTRQSLLPALAARIRELHGYECPSIVALPVGWGDPDYLRWIADETRPG